MVQDITATKQLLSNSTLFYASHRQFNHHHLNQRHFQVSGESQGLQQDLHCFSGIEGMAQRADLLQEHRRQHGSGSLMRSGLDGKLLTE